MECSFALKYLVKFISEDDEIIGSGIIVKLEEFNNNFFVFTSKHTFEDNDKKLQIEDSDFSICYDEKLFYQSYIILDEDIIVFIFDNNNIEKIKQLDQVNISIKSDKFGDCFFRGYASSETEEDSLCEPCTYLQELETKKNLFRIRPTRETDSFDTDGLSNAKGLSGSGLFIKNDKTLVGIIKEHERNMSAYNYIALAPLKDKIIKKVNNMIYDDIVVPQNLINEIENKNVILVIGDEFSTNIGKFLSHKDFIIEVLNSLNSDYKPLKSMFEKGIMDNNLVLNTLKDKENKVIKKKIVEIYGGKCDYNQIINTIWNFTSTIVTVNYDSLFHINDDINIISKLNEYSLLSSNPTSKNLLHLHGSADDIENILIFENEYKKLYSSEEIVKIKSLFQDKTCLFIGFSTNEVYFESLFSSLSGLKKNYIISTNNSDFSKYNLEHIRVKNYVQIKDTFKNIIKNENTDVIVKNDVPSHSIKLNNKYLEKINDLGVKFRHKYKPTLFLDDMFVYQDIEKIETENKTRISAEELLKLDNFNKCILFGSEISGKTSLAYQLQKKFNKNGLLPIYINAKDINKLDIKKFKNSLIRRVKKQYSKEYEEIFKSKINKKCKDIIIIIDNFELLNNKRFEVKKKFLEDIELTFHNVILFSDESSRIDLKNKQTLSEFTSFKIKEYGYFLRDKMIERWIVLGRENTISDSEVLEEKDEISKKIEMIIKNKYIPTYPLYILVLLQQIETATPNNFKGSAYAEFYSYLITEALGNSKVKIDDLDYYRTYLSFIAFQFFKSKTQEFSEEKMMKLHSQYSDMMDINKSFLSVYTILNDAKIIKSDNSFYAFNHNYIYYFFVAYYMSSNIENSEVKKMITDMSKKLHSNEDANIIIFLIHHSRKQIIIENILDESSKIFSNIEPTTFKPKEFTYIYKLVEDEIQKAITLDDTKSSIERRKEHLKKKDVIEESKNNNISVKKDSSDDMSQLDFIAKINVAFKLIEILGQISKNYFGSLNKWKKRDILENTYSLGLKSLNVILTHLNENIEEFEKIIKIMMDKEKIPIEDKNRINLMIKKEISDIVNNLSIIFVKKISDNIASQNLLPTISKITKDEKLFRINLKLRKIKFTLEKEMQTLNDYNYHWKHFSQKNNFELNPVLKLIELAVKLDFSRGLNKDEIFELKKEFKKNIMAQNVLQFLVAEHLYKFDVSIEKKQAVCEKLSISLKSQKQMLIEKR